MYKYSVYLLVLVVLSSCTDRDGDTAETFNESLSVTLVTSLNGAGDNGYNDLILSGAIGEGSTVYIDVKGKDLTVN